MVNNDCFLHLISLYFLQIWILRRPLFSTRGGTIRIDVVNILKNGLFEVFALLFDCAQRIIFNIYARDLK